MKTEGSMTRMAGLVVGALAVASIPAVLFGVTYDNISISDQAEFGSGATFSTTPGLVSIGDSNAPYSHSLAVGSNLAGHSSTPNALLVGKWNEVTDSKLAVGIGTGSGDKRNAFEVHADGAINVLELQGDLQAGDFWGAH